MYLIIIHCAISRNTFILQIKVGKCIAFIGLQLDVYCEKDRRTLRMR